jgi:hypothetical protein
MIELNAVASWLIDDQWKNPHGKVFKSWWVRSVEWAETGAAKS